jgi:hypothetical protein
MTGPAETHEEETRAKAEGLEAWFRARLLNGLTRLVVILLIPGGLITAMAPRNDLLLTAALCASICAAAGVVMTIRILLILRALRTHPERAIVRLTKWRKLQRAGFTPYT